MAHNNYYLDLCVDTYVVNEGAVLLRMHDKYNYWGAPGGHIDFGGRRQTKQLCVRCGKRLASK